MHKPNYSIALVALASILMTGCVATTEIYRDEVRVRSEKLACRSDCPEYELSLYGDGWATFKGYDNVSLKGDYRKFLGKSTIDSLIMLFDETAFFTLPKEVPSRGIGSKQDVILSLRMGKYYNEVLYRDNGPAVFRKIDLLLDEVAKDESGWELIPDDQEENKGRP